MSDRVLHLDLSKDATRKNIFGLLVAAIDESQRGPIGRVVGDGSIPAETRFHNLAEVEAGIRRTVATDSAKDRAIEIYHILAEAEADVHGCEVEETHFHEVGRGMTVREIIGIATAIDLIDPELVTCTPIQTGCGKVECEHGVLDIPAPATAAIINRFAIPTIDETLDGELCTPTSAAVIAYLVDEFV